MFSPCVILVDQSSVEIRYMHTHTHTHQIMYTKPIPSPAMTEREREEANVERVVQLCMDEIQSTQI